MKKLALVLSAAALSLAPMLVRADTADEAKALLDQAVALFKAKGKEAAVQEINAGGSWKKGALYVVVAQYDGHMLAHSANDKMAGKNMLEAKDAGGKFFVKETIAGVRSKGAAQIDMRWGNPVTKQIADATMYSRAVPGLDLYVGSVVFK
jgi:signal transduction histidine kinase